jgi:hypothetical protein
MSNLSSTIENFIWRIENITPTDPVPDRGWKYVPEQTFDPDKTKGVARVFEIFWLGSGEDGAGEPGGGVTDIAERVADHEFEVQVAYSTSYLPRELQRIIAQDRHDLAKALRNLDNRLGTSAANPTENIGLWGRNRIRDNLDRSGTHTWYLRMAWVCTIKEDE